MDFCSDAATRRRTARTLTSRFFNGIVLLVLGLMAMAWSGESLAQSCDFVNVDPAPSKLGLPNTSVSFTFQAQTACAGTVTGSIAITTDSTGGATAPTTFTATLDTDETFSVLLGPTPGGTGTVVVTCLVGGCAGDTISYTFGTNNDFDYIANVPLPVVANQITPFTVGTNLQFNGAPGGLATSFTNLTDASNYGTVAPDGAGDADITQSIFNAGTYVVRGTLNCPVAFVLEGCAAVAPVDMTVQVEPVQLLVVGSNAPSTPSGTPLTLTTDYGSASIPAADGTNITWTVTAQPAGGDGAVAGNPVLGGESTATFTATVPGTYTVNANSGCTFCAVPQQNFTITVTALPFALSAISANPATGSVGNPIAFTVRLEQGGTPVNAATIQWTATAPFAPANLASGTNAAGDASGSFTPSAAGSFAGAITATYDPDGVPANGDELAVSFDANVAFVASLAATSGGGQNALVNTAFALPLQVNALNSGVPAAGVTINWTVAGDATLVPGGPTDAAGNATATVTAGATAGAVTITAARQDDPTATAVFNLTVDALGSLMIVSGDAQTLAAGVASAPLEVELTDAGGAPVAGATINWSTTAGTLAAATSLTNAAGIASNTVTLATAGSVDVTASSALAAAPVVFSLNGALSGLPGLSVQQIEVANAIDNACPALAALPGRTPAQQDLLQRCQELTTAAGIDPAAAIGAIDQLLADVALTQANAAFSALQSQFQNLKTRIAALRSGTNGTSFGGLALSTPAGPISLGTLGAAFGAVDDPTEIGTDFSRWGFFAAGTIGRGEADPGQRNPAYDYDIEGLTAGVDYRKNDKWIFGASLGYTRQDTQLPGERGGLDTNGWTVSAYTTFYQQDSWYMDGVVTWGRNDYELLRRIRYTLPLAGGGTSSVDQTARADASGDLLSTATTFGRDFNRGAWSIGPYGRLLYTRVGFDAINETLEAGEPGSGLGLRIQNRDVTSLASVLGGKFTYTHSADWGVLIPHLQLEWEHEFKDDPQAVEARFINDPTGTAMVVRGDPLDTDYFRLGLGLSMVLTGGRSGFMYYEQLVGRNGMSQWNLALGLRMEF